MSQETFKLDKNSMLYWYPKIEGKVPTPKTVILKLKGFSMKWIGQHQRTLTTRGELSNPFNDVDWVSRVGAKSWSCPFCDAMPIKPETVLGVWREIQCNPVCPKWAVQKEGPEYQVDGTVYQDYECSVCGAFYNLEAVQEPRIGA